MLLTRRAFLAGAALTAGALVVPATWRATHTGSAAAAHAPHLRIGPFVDGAPIDNVTATQALVTQFQGLGFNSWMAWNSGPVTRGTAGLAVTDAAGYDTVVAPFGDLNAGVTPAQIVAACDPHPSVSAYIVWDDVTLSVEDALIAREAAFKAASTRPSGPCWGGGIGSEIGAAVAPTLWCNDPYYWSTEVPPGGDGYLISFAQMVRLQLQGKPAGVPIDLILQTHGGGDDLRYPSPAEVSQESWIALGEGAKSLHYFCWQTENFWVGLRDNLPLLAAASAFSRRALALDSLLGPAVKVPDQWTMGGTNYPYVSTMVSGSYIVLVAVNQDVTSSRTLTLSPLSGTAQLTDAESGAVYMPGKGIVFGPGDAHVFVVGSYTPGTTPTATATVGPTATSTPTPTPGVAPTPTTVPTPTPSPTPTIAPTPTPCSIAKGGKGKCP